MPADLNQLALPDLFASIVARDRLDRLLDLAVEEDLGAAGDVTTISIVEPDRTATAAVVARRAGVAAGLPAAAILVEREADVRYEPVAGAGDGGRCRPGRVLARLHGSLRAILTVERPLLNLLCHLGGIATLTSRFVEAVAGTRAVICDTRKTTPGLRALEKYAVRCGGGTLHRTGLSDAALYKDNHLAHLPAACWTRTLAEAVTAARASADLAFVEVEIDRLDQLRDLLALEPGILDMVLLDNMSVGDLAAAVRLRDAVGPRPLLEASGGVTLDTVAAIAASGVDRISVGAITHSAPALDIGLDIGPETGR